MSTLQTLLLVFQVIVAIALVGFILVQHGKGADAGAAFGSGASSTVFGSRGSSNFFSKATTVLAVLFLGNSLLLGYLAANTTSQQPASLLENAATPMTFETDAMPEDSQESEAAAAAAANEAAGESPSESDAGTDAPLVPQQ